MKDKPVMFAKLFGEREGDRKARKQERTEDKKQIQEGSLIKQAVSMITVKLRD